MVVFHHAAPGRVDHGGPLVARPDAVLPVVFIGKTAARPAQHRHLDFLQRGDHVIADAAGVGDRAVFAHPDAAINAMAEMLGKLPVDIAIDDRPRLIGLDDERGVEDRRRLLRRRRGKTESQSQNDAKNGFREHFGSVPHNRPSIKQFGDQTAVFRQLGRLRRWKGGFYRPYSQEFSGGFI